MAKNNPVYTPVCSGCTHAYPDITCTTCAIYSYGGRTNFDPKYKSNADQLRASDWDMASFLGSLDVCPPTNPKCEHECNFCWLEWLQAPVKEGGGLT